ncbi:MAG: penicillin-binding protein 2 [Patescibacteria group bacterium]
MKSLKRDFKKSGDNKSKLDGRLIFLSAIIFFMFFSLVFRLYKIQIIDFDYFSSMASAQHNIYSELKAKRGEILLKKNIDNSYYYIATNKDFSSLYIIPRLIGEDDIYRLVENFYITFHQDEVIAEVDKFLEEEELRELDEELLYVDSLNMSDEEKALKKNEVRIRRSNLVFNEEWLEFKKMKRDLEIEERKQSVISSYYDKFKNSDKYSRMLKRKVDDESLLLFYFNFLKEELNLISPNDLHIKGGKIIKKDDEIDISSRIRGFYYEWESLRSYPEKTLLAHLSGFCNYDNIGNYGLEEFFNSQLSGEDGYLLGDKGTYKGEKIIIEKKEYKAPVNGKNLVLTIDYAVQVHVCNKLKEASEKYLFDSGSISVMDPKTGKIIALCNWPLFDPNNYQEAETAAVFDNQFLSHQYESGSVFKTITMAASINEGGITPHTTFEDKGQIMISGWDKPIRNSDYATYGAHGVVSMNYALENSLNTGAIFAANKIGKETFSEYLQKFGFGERVGIELSGEAPGNISNLTVKNVKDIDFATASFGQGIAITPLQLLSSYAAIANNGLMMKPYIVDEFLDDDYNLVEKTNPRSIRQVISEETSKSVSAMLFNVIEDGHASSAGVQGYYIGGKTGTAQIPSPKGGYYTDRYIHNFIGYGPINDPKFVMLVKFDNPKTVKYAASSAAPVFGEIAEFLLKYYNVPIER